MNAYYEFITYCERGDLEAAKEIYNLNPNLEISKLDEYAFALACNSKNLELVKWLLQIKPDIDIAIDSNKPFNAACAKPLSNACSGGHVEIAKFLYDLLPIKPVIDNKLFRVACSQGCKSLANWFLELENEIDISENLSIAFTMACQTKNLDFINWLNEKFFMKYELKFADTYILGYGENKEYHYNALMYCLKNANILNFLDVSTILDLKDAICI